MGNSPAARERYNDKRRERRRLERENKNTGKEFCVQSLPDGDMTIDELVAHRKRVFKLRDEAELARMLVNVEVKIDGPYGILHFGDPHVDDDGTDWFAIERDIKVVKKTNELFAASIGDSTNNWVGRLGHLYGQQSTTARQAWMLAEYFFNELGDNLLYVIAGNHDAWSGSGDPLKWIARQNKQAYEMSGIRISLNQGKGDPIIVNARHDFPGSSQWNDVHGAVKAAKIDGYRDDMYVCGHKHKSGYSCMKDPGSDKVIHCIQLASYKKWDRYAKEKGFKDLSISPSVVTVIDPRAPSASKVQLFWDTELGANYLKWLRSKK